jgi:hypothetical protein
MTMKKLSAAVLAASLFATVAAAEPMDIATIKCSDLAAMPPEGISMLLTWIDGYMGGQATDTAFDLERMQANIDGAATACSTTPDATLMEVLNAAENG